MYIQLPPQCGAVAVPLVGPCDVAPLPFPQGGAAAAPHAGSSADATNTDPLFQSGRPEVVVAPVLVAPDIPIPSHDVDVIATATNTERLLPFGTPDVVVAPVVVAPAITIAVVEERFFEDVNNRLLAQMLGLPIRQQYPPPRTSQQLIDYFRTARSRGNTPTRRR